MSVVTRTLIETGMRVSFSKKYWPAWRDRIDATKYVPDKEFPGRCEVEANFVRRVPTWNAKHPLLRHEKTIGAQLWSDPRDPLYFAGTKLLPMGAKGAGKRWVQQEMVVWKGRHWCHRDGKGWIKSTDRIDPAIINTQEREEPIEQ